MYPSSTYEFKRALNTPTLGTIALCFGLASTGATFNVDNIELWRDFVKPRATVVLYGEGEAVGSSEKQTVTEEYIDIRNISQHLANIRDVFSPSMSEIAQDLGISRQALYKWISGENNPTDDVKVNLITNLSRSADAFKKAAVPDAGLLLKMKAFNGKSLKDVIKSEGVWQDAVAVLIKESEVMEQSYSKSGLGNSKGVVSSDWKSSVSLPGMTENV